MPGYGYACIGCLLPARTPMGRASHQATGASLALRSARTQMTHHANHERTTPHHLTPHTSTSPHCQRRSAFSPLTPTYSHPLHPHSAILSPRRTLRIVYSASTLLDPGATSETTTSPQSPAPRPRPIAIHSLSYPRSAGKLKSRRVIVLVVVTLVRSVTPLDP